MEEHDFSELFERKRAREVIMAISQLHEENVIPCVNEVSEHLDWSMAKTSREIRHLKENGLLSCELADGTRKKVSLTPLGMEFCILIGKDNKNHNAFFGEMIRYVKKRLV